MKHQSRPAWGVSVIVALGAAAIVASPGCQRLAPTPRTPDTYTLQDFLNRNWQNELVTFPLSTFAAGQAEAKKALAAPAGKTVPYQIVEGSAAGGKRIAFMVDLPAFATASYQFTNLPPSQATDLAVEETADTIRLLNGKTGIAIAKVLKSGQGPIQGVRLQSGQWTGASSLSSNLVPTAYSVRVTARGPVFSEAVARTSFGSNQTWEVRFRLQAREPVVLIEETMGLQAGEGSFAVTLDTTFKPDTLLSRWGKGTLGKNGTYPIEPGLVYTMEAWVHWSERERQGNCCGLYAKDGSDLLVLAAGLAGEWVDPDMPADRRAPTRLNLTRDPSGLNLTFPLRNGRRMWMLGALDKNPSVAFVADSKNEFKSPPYYQLLIKHGHFPLDPIKDYVLRWKHDSANHPRLMLSKTDAERFRASVTNAAAYSNQIPRYIHDPNGINQGTMEGPITAYLATGDPALGKYLADAACAMVQNSLEIFFGQDTVPYGAAPHHHQVIGSSVLLADAVMSSDALTPQQRERLLAQVAFIGYAINRPDFWSPIRGYAANPNMTTSVYGYRTTIACFIPTHPLAKEWIKEGFAELKDQLDNWSDANGGWLEAPHYAMVSYDQILAVLRMTGNSGLSNDLYQDPKVRTIADWFGKISTPPDSRLKGSQHLPPVGNTYMCEPTGEFGILAFLFRDKDPAFASRMQWLYRQHGSFPQPGIGGGYPGFAGWRGLLTDPAIAARAPAWKSELFPETGVILRNAYPSDRETQLYMIAGRHHAHYDQDSGSFTLYGKGRILAEDFGYYGCAPADDHSLVESPIAANAATMAIRDFAPADAFDYVAGVNAGWTRQIAFVKDPDPLAPNYFVVHDHMAVPAPFTWRLWLTTAKVTTAPMTATSEGKEDADLDVFFTQPQGLELKTEDKARTSGCGIRPDGNMGPYTSTQTGIIATPSQRARDVFTVLYPRLKTEARPEITALAGGRGVKVQAGGRTDYVFLSETPLQFKEGDVSFEGMAGCVQQRAGQPPTLVLGVKGQITAGGRTVTSDTPTKLGDSAIFPNGDFESGKPAPFVAATSNEGREAVPVAVRLAEGNPVPGDTAHAGKYCLAIDKQADGGTAVSVPVTLYMDAAKTYRIRAKVYTTAAIGMDMGGYGSDGRNSNLKTAAGAGWQYDVIVRGPLTAWKSLETTVGPAGSGAALTWPDGFLSTGMTLWLSGSKGTLYLDDIAFEEMPAVPAAAR